MENYPENHRMKWTEDETKLLITEINNKTSIKKIASNHKRTIGAIKYKIYRIIIEDITNMRKLNLKYEEPSITYLAKLTSLSNNDLIDGFDKLKFSHNYKCEENNSNNKYIYYLFNFSMLSSWVLFYYYLYYL